MYTIRYNIMILDLVQRSSLLRCLDIVNYPFTKLYDHPEISWENVGVNSLMPLALFCLLCSFHTWQMYPTVWIGPWGSGFGPQPLVWLSGVRRSLAKAELWGQDDWVRASEKLQLCSGPRKTQWWTGHRLIDTRGQRRLARVVPSNRQERVMLIPVFVVYLAAKREKHS